MTRRARLLAWAGGAIGVVLVLLLIVPLLFRGTIERRVKTAVNERRVAFLAEIGERRERAKASERCLYAPMRLRTESGEACVDDDGQQIVVQFAVPPGSRPNCNCIYAALADDGLSRYLDDRNPLSVRSTLSYVAQHLHADEGWSIEDAIAKWKARDEARHRAVLAGRLPPQGPNR